MCIVCIANNINRNVYMYLNIRIFPTTGYARVLLFMFIMRELGGMVQDVYFSLHTVSTVTEEELLFYFHFYAFFCSFFSFVFFSSSDLH